LAINSNQLTGNVILAFQASGVYDVNRNEIIATDDYNLIQTWCESITKLELQGIIFHNNYSHAFCEKYSNKFIQFIKIDFDTAYKPNVFRYLIYDEFLKTQHNIKNIFVTDITDVVVIQNPFKTEFFKTNTNKIFCGDEPTILQNEWMQAHSEHLRLQITDYLQFEKTFANEPLLNCGIIGGNIKIMQNLISQLAQIHKQYNFENKTAYTGDMGAFNYIMRTKFNTQFLHGFPINTIFKKYETARTDCWFRHK
jgi:hypothetical protein